MAGLITLIVCVLLLIFFLIRKRRIKESKPILPSNFRELLNENVAYYRLLNHGDKIRFEEKIKDFLSYVNIHGVNANVDELDELLVASSAVIPVFGFNNWHYYNLKHVLLYEDAFAKENFSTDAAERNTLGMVGTGAMQRMMILSKPALRQGFKNETDKYNTGIHEFVHLLDKADGDTDGIPGQLLGKQHTISWLNLMNEKIEEIKKGNSDINPYGATSKTEFFAVVAEYFFQRPDLLKENHPELYELMEQVFQQNPLSAAKAN